MKTCKLTPLPTQGLLGPWDFVWVLPFASHATSMSTLGLLLPESPLEYLGRIASSLGVSLVV